MKRGAVRAEWRNGQYRHWSSGGMSMLHHLLIAVNDDALNESGEAVFGYLTSVVVLAGASRDEVAGWARQVLKVLADRGFSGRLETEVI